MPQIFSIPFGANFASTLARYLLRETNPLVRAQKVVFLPTRQACLDVTNALHREHSSSPILLPALIPLGDMDPDEVALSTQAGAHLMRNMPPLITAQRRQLLLATLLMSYQKTQNRLSLDRAIDLARDLMRLIDEMRSNDIPLDHLERLDPHVENAEHWHHIVSFLHIISRHWDTILREENVIESIPYLARLRHHQIEQWEDRPPQTEVIIAGSQGTIQSTRQLMAALLTLPLGTLILHGFEREESPNMYPELSPTHPQYHHYDLLKKLSVNPESIQSLISEDHDDKRSIALYEAPHSGKEAQIIALKIREALQNPALTILCVSPDRTLLDRVAIELSRWHISATPHQGRSLLTTPWGSFITNAALCFQEDRFLTTFLGLLKHPFSSIPQEIVIAFELALRRYGLPTSIEHIQRDIAPHLASHNPLLQEAVVTLLKQVKKIYYNPSLSVGQKHHLLMALVLGTEDTEGYIVQHASPESADAALFLTSLREAVAAMILHDTPYGDLVRKLMENVYHHASNGSLRNIRLMTPAEARLLSADVVILGGMNEGCWPMKLTPDPLLSRGLKLTLGLVPPERMIGQSTHDFLGLVARGPVFITRSLYTLGTPTGPSRLLVRLRKKIILDTPSTEMNVLEEWYEGLIHTTPLARVTPPRPCPSSSLRPTTYSVTDIETLMRDPYSFYAKRLLNLPKMNALSEEPSARHFGLFIHKFLEEWVHHPASIENARPLFEQTFRSSLYKNFWWQRALDVIQKVTRHQSTLRPNTIMTEVYGSMTLMVYDRPITIHGRADRIDRYNDGIVILDYKTGASPRLSNIRNGTHPQLGIEAAFHVFGSFKNVPKSLPIQSIQCWVLGRDKKFDIVSLDIDPLALAIHMREGMNNLLHFFMKDAPYLSHPWGDFSENNYSHLSRVAEWKRL